MPKHSRLGERKGQSIRTRSAFERIATTVEQCADAMAVVLAIGAAYRLYIALGIGKQIHFHLPWLLSVAILFAGVLVGVFAGDGGYQRGHSLMRLRETERILRATLAAFLLAFSASLLAGQLIPRAFLGISMLLVPCFLLAEKQCVYALLRRVGSSRITARRAIIYGAGVTGRRVYSALVRSPKLTLNPIAMVDDDAELSDTWIRDYSYRHANSVVVRQGPLTVSMLREANTEVVIIAIPSLAQHEFAEVLSIAAQAGVEVAFTPRLSSNSDFVTSYADIDGVLLASAEAAPGSRGYDSIKRIFDFVLSAILLLCVSPLWLVAAVLIRLQSPGQVIFSQDRIGKFGVPFRIYKFRTMYANTPQYAPHPQEVHDKRITPFGRWLRRTSLDELPQLLNVLKGEMSLVGPRPEMPFVVEGYEEHHWQRVHVLPGITGVWQLSADRALPIHHNIQYDFYYIRNRSLLMDFAILLHTLVFAMRGL